MHELTQRKTKISHVNIKNGEEKRHVQSRERMSNTANITLHAFISQVNIQTIHSLKSNRIFTLM